MGGFNLDLYASEEIFLFKKLKKKARADRKRILILHKHPLVTSARKMRLYTRAGTSKIPGQNRPPIRQETLKDPKQCHTWYNGRR